MAKSEVKLRTPAVPGILLGRAKWEFRASHDDKLVGTLELSNGSVIWRPRYQAKAQTATFNSWQEFANYMQDYKRVKATKKKTKKNRAKNKRTASYW